MIELSVTKKLFDASGNMDLKVEFSVQTGEFVMLYGPSGAGKTSILKMVAGLMNPDAGFIRVNGDIWFNKNEKINLKPRVRLYRLKLEKGSMVPFFLKLGAIFALMA